MTGAILSNIDVAQVVLYAFWIFFAGLLWYIRQEDRREGYPLEDDQTGDHNKFPWLFVPSPKTFILPHGAGTKSVPDFVRDPMPTNAERVAFAPGSPLEPTGNPLLAGVGPGSWVARSNVPDKSAHGENRIQPLRSAKEFSIPEGEINPIGMSVVGCDGQAAGTVKDVWVDISEQLIRYYEVEVGTGNTARTVLLPNNFVVFKTALGRKYLYVHAITAAQFLDVPATSKKTSITFLEEDKITAYFGAGLLYAVPGREEPLI